jgi:hypothetical protein
MSWGVYIKVLYTWAEWCNIPIMECICGKAARIRPTSMKIFMDKNTPFCSPERCGALVSGITSINPFRYEVLVSGKDISKPAKFVSDIPCLLGTCFSRSFLMRKAFFLSCPFEIRGVECFRGNMDGSRPCGCKDKQKVIIFTSGFSQAQRRKALKAKGLQSRWGVKGRAFQQRF